MSAGLIEGLAMADVTGLDELLQVLDRLGKEAPKALADAINHTSNQSRIALKQEMQFVFTSPTPFTLNAIAVDVAKPVGDPEGAVFVKDMAGGKNQSPTDWLEPQVFGGERKLKDSEEKLRALGVLPAGMYTVPGKGAKIDAYGNMANSHIIQILWGMRRLKTHGRSRRHSEGDREPFFILHRGGIPIGIAERTGKSIKVVLVFTSKPSYSKRLDYSAVVERVADENLLTNIDAAVVKLLS